MNPQPSACVSASVSVSELLARLSSFGGTLSDGHHRIAWATIDEPLAILERFATRYDLAPNEPVLLECVNSVPGALTLLALLSRGSTVVLVPAPRPGAPSSWAPSFCRWRLRVRDPLGGQLDDISLQRPETFLNVEQLATYRRLPVDSTLRQDHLLLRTSGSLGAPKLVVHRHATAVANARNAVDRLALSSQDRILIPVPLAHMYGLGAAFLPALEVGASVELLAGANLLRYRERERSVQPTVAFLTPNLCATLVRPRAAPSHYRHVVVAGDKLSPEPFAELEAIYHRVINLYGSTEMGVVCAADPRDDDGPRATTVGRPLPGVELDLRSQEDGERDVGELWCRHPFGFEVYVDEHGAPIKSEAAHVYPTRDLARLGPDGLIELLGRCDHAVKRDGRLLPLVEVERALEQLPGVERAAAIVAGQSKRGRGIVAFCASQTGAGLESESLRRTCLANMPAYAVPDQIHLLSALPLLPSGKLDRGALRQTLSDPPRTRG